MTTFQPYKSKQVGGRISPWKDDQIIDLVSTYTVYNKQTFK